MTSKLTDLFSRTKLVIQDEGLIAFVGKAFAFVVRKLFFYETHYLLEHTLEERAEKEYMPKISDFALKIISSNREVDELTSEGLDFRPWYPVYRERLDKGAIVFCVFVGQEFATMGWIAMTEEAKQSMCEAPMRVDFLHDEAYGGGDWTRPKYRRMGLKHYVDLEVVKFLRRERKTVARALVRRGNTAPRTRLTKLGWNTYAEGRYLKILWWKSWKEKPLTTPSTQSLPD